MTCFHFLYLHWSVGFSNFLSVCVSVCVGWFANKRRLESSFQSEGEGIWVWPLCNDRFALKLVFTDSARSIHTQMLTRDARKHAPSPRGRLGKRATLGVVALASHTQSSGSEF